MNDYTENPELTESEAETTSDYREVEESLQAQPFSRSESLERALRQWSDELHELEGSRTAQAQLELSAAHPSGLVRLYSGQSTKLSSLVREPSALAHSRRKAREVINALEDQQRRHGFAQVHLGMGMAEWSESILAEEEDADVVYEAATSGIMRRSVPVLLRPVTLALTSDDDIEVKLESDLQINPVFWQALVAEGADASEAQILAAANTVHGFTPGAALTALHELGSAHLIGFDMVDSLVIGIFQQPYEVVLNDIEALRQNLEHSDVVAAVAGNEEALDRLAKHIPTGQKTDPDPENETGVGDLDPSQHAVLKNVAAGLDLLLDAAPGSEVETTLAAVLADCVAKGRSSAFIPGDSRATQRLLVVLHDLGLEDLVLDMSEPNHWRSNAIQTLHETITEALSGQWLHEASAAASSTSDDDVTVETGQAPEENKTEASEKNESQPLNPEEAQLAIAGEADDAQASGKDAEGNEEPQVVTVSDETQFLASQAAGASPQELRKIREQLKSARHGLAGYIDSLHHRRKEFGVSAFDALQVLTDLTAMNPAPSTAVRLPASVISDIASDGATRARKLLQDAADLGIFVMSRGNSAWYGAVMSGPEKVKDVVARVRKLANEDLPVVLAQINSVSGRTGLIEARTLSEWDEQLQMLQEAALVMRTFTPEIFENSAADMVIAAAPNRWRKDNSINMKRRQRKELVAKAESFLVRKVSPKELHAELIEVQRQRKIWLTYSGGKGYPRIPTNLAECRGMLDKVTAELDELRDVLGTAYGDLQRMYVDDLLTVLSRMDADEVGASQLPKQVKVLTNLNDLGLGELVDDLRARKVPVEMVIPELDLAWWASVLSLIVAEDTALSQLDGKALNLLSEQFRTLDRMHVESLAPQLLRNYRKSVMELVGRVGTDAIALQEQTAPGANISINELRRRFPWISQLRPIWIVPPALVPQVWDPQAGIDVVALCGVENNPMAQLLPALGRASQVLVVGDSRRRRPGAATSLASVLPKLKLPPSRQKTNEAIAAFMSAQGYGSSVISVPVPRATTSLVLTVVDGRGMPAPGHAAIESTPEEVEEIVNQVLAHAHSGSSDSLTVITLNERHSVRVREAVISAAAHDPEADAYLSRNGVEPFTVMDVANVDGLIRDRIILGIGYGKTAHGRVVHDFGDISTPAGPGLLVEALSAVRKDLSIVTAIAPDEFDTNRLHSAGTLMMVDLLKLAEQGAPELDPLRVAAQMSEEQSRPDRLLVDLAQRLFKLGLTVIPNFGMEHGMRIPLALGHPQLPNELLVAVLTDTPEYVAEPSLRVRERHWSERLEDYGWSVYMAYSMAVFIDPQGEAEKIAQFVLNIIESRKQAKLDNDSSPSKVMRPGELALLNQKHEEEASAWGNTPTEAPVAMARGPRPPVASNLPLSGYSDDQLDDLVKWICSDGLQRTEAQTVEELRSELGLRRRGAQVDAVLANVVRRNL